MNPKKYLPLMIEISNKNILLIGGGKAAAEKLRTLSQLKKKNQSHLSRLCRRISRT